MNVSWIGCGNMGRPMATNLLKGGNQLYVFDTSPENLEQMVSIGAKAVNSPAEAAEMGTFVFTMLPDGKILKDVVLNKTNGILRGLHPETSLVDMSTISLSESEEVNLAVSGCGSKFLRAPVTGSTSLAESASLGIFASGPETLFHEVLPLFQLIGNHFHYLGDGEQARVLKLAINLMVAANMQILAESMLLVDRAGLERKQAMDIIAKSAAGSPVINYKMDNIITRDYTPAFSVAMMEKDLDLVLSAAKEYHLGLPVTSLTRQFLAMIHSEGDSHLDFSCLVDFMERISAAN